MEKTITAIFNGFAQMQAGKMLVFFGGLALLVSSVVRIGNFEFNLEMAGDMRDAGIVMVLLGAYFSWVKAKADAEERRTNELMAFHERLGRLEEKVRNYHGDGVESE